MLTLDRLKSLLRYDPDTGIWTRAVATSGRNGKRRHAGSVAGKIGRQGYVLVSVDGRSYGSCRLAFFYMTGEWPPIDVDHIDRNRSNDRWANLRLATRSQNGANCGVRSSNQLGVKGVGRNDAMKSRPFYARIVVNGSRKYLGYFEITEEASAAYADAAHRYFGEFAAVV